MALANLYNVPTTPEQLNNWAFAHMSHHRDIIRVVYQVLALALPEYALDPVVPSSGGAPYNLLGLDWNNENKLSAWIQLNADEHRRAGNILGLG